MTSSAGQVNIYDVKDSSAESKVTINLGSIPHRGLFSTRKISSPQPSN